MSTRTIFTFLAGLALALAPAVALAQTELDLGTSSTDLDFKGTGSSTIQVSIRTQVLLSGWSFGSGSASGAGGAASTGGSYTIYSSVQVPMTLSANADGTYSVNQSSDLNFSYSSPQGTLTGVITLFECAMVSGSNNTATATGTMTNLGGSFASAFGTSADVNLVFALGANLSTLVNTYNTITGQVEYGSTITPPSGGTCGDFVTGGGWITGTPSGAKGNFGVGGGIKNGQLWGHLEYIDHGTGMNVHGTSVTSYTVCGTDSTTRCISGTAEVNHQSGFTYNVVVDDKGEPGRNDIFQISVSNGYSAGGDLGGSHPGGGNIQLHKPAPSCKKNK